MCELKKGNPFGRIAHFRKYASPNPPPRLDSFKGIFAFSFQIIRRLFHESLLPSIMRIACIVIFALLIVSVNSIEFDVTIKITRVVKRPLGI